MAYRVHRAQLGLMIPFIENTKFVTKFNTHSVTTLLATEPVTLFSNHPHRMLCVYEITHYLPQSTPLIS
jgi:hypothetical protein